MTLRSLKFVRLPSSEEKKMDKINIKLVYTGGRTTDIKGMRVPIIP